MKLSTILCVFHSYCRKRLQFTVGGETDGFLEHWVILYATELNSKSEKGTRTSKHFLGQGFCSPPSGNRSKYSATSAGYDATAISRSPRNQGSRSGKLKLILDVINDVRFRQYIQLYTWYLLLKWTGPAAVLCDSTRSSYG